MWKDYSVSYIKNNKASSISIMMAAFIATLFLSLLCSLFYNFWTYDIERIVLEEGDWQGRIVGEISEDDLSMINNFPNVERAVINEERSAVKEIVVDIYFQNTRTIYKDLPLITQQLGFDQSAAEYHLLLLSKYLIHDPKDKEPPLLLSFYLFILVIVSLSLILIIRNSFAVTMNSRIHQFGIFSSIGATPRQIRTCLMQEAIIICSIPIIIGSLLGIAISFGLTKVINSYAANVIGRHEAVFQYHPLILVVTLLSSIITVLFSAWRPARKLSKLTPLKAIHNTSELLLGSKRHSRILSLLFGMEGELAGNALKAQKKALRTSTISLLLSFLGFTLMLCFFTLSSISTRHTYFERYQDAWDVMVAVKDTDIEDFQLTDELQKLTGVRESTVYQKGVVETPVASELQSDELLALGGLGTVTETSVSEADGMILVTAPIVILDDTSFAEYCIMIGVTARLDGAIILNQVWDNINSDFRSKHYIPFIKENRISTVQRSAGQDVELPVLAYTQKVPILREEYDNFALVHFIPLSLWNEIRGQMDAPEKVTYIRVLAAEGITHAELNALEEKVTQLLGQEYKIKSENRLQEKVSNDEIIRGFMLILGAFCSLLAIIGIANVFSNTMGFLRQRKREFAQYMSIGMTPASMRKMFCIEALVFAGRPLFITLPLSTAFVGFAVTASHIDPGEFLVEIPMIPITVFCLAIFVFVALAYYIGSKRLLQCDLSEALRNDSLV